MNTTNQGNYSNHNWMTTTPQFDALSLNEMTLPGTHNAGSDWKASYPLFGPPRHWLACQHDSFYAQLSHGSRALDIRLMSQPSAKGLGKFRMHHNEHPNSRTLGHLMSDINQFLGENPDEFIVVDVHKMSGPTFDFRYFNEVVQHLFGDRIIPPNNARLTLGQLKKISSTQRVLFATPTHSELSHEVFFEQINHKWIGTGIVNADELNKYISEVMEYPPGKWALWSLSATSYATFGGPVDIHEHLNIWFDPKNSDWAMKCNIINVDFIEESNIVAYCHMANLKRAAGKR